MNLSSKFKGQLVSITLVLALFIVGANVFVVSVIGYHINSKQSIKDAVTGVQEETNILHAKRGNILDRNGSVLAQDVISYSLYAILDSNRLNSDQSPAYVFDPEGTARALAPIMGSTYEEIYAYLDKDAKQVEFGNVGKYLNGDQKQAIEDLALPGIGFTEIVSRNYPLAPFAPNIIGFANYLESEDELTGLLGIEELYNNELRGVNGYEKYQRDKRGYKIKQSQVYTEKAKDGSDIKLTLDRSIQEKFEAAMQNMVENPKIAAYEVWGSVVEVKTGKILAWSEFPRFDREDPNTNWNSRGVQYLYEPGSTMKTFTVASAMNEGGYNNDETFESTQFHVGLKDGSIVRLPNSEGAIHTIYNAGRISYGTDTYRHGYAISSNVMIVELLTKPNGLKLEVFNDYLHKLGFFKEVKMDRFEDLSGHELWQYPVEKISNGFGQGSTVTMLQMIQAFTTVMGDGTLVKPYIIDEITDGSTGEVTYKGETQRGEQVFSEDTAKRIKDSMRDVITMGGSEYYGLEDVDVIGKTGTAQMVVDGKYSTSDYLMSMVLGFPYEDPEIMIYFAYKADFYANRRLVAEEIKNVMRQVLTVYEFSSEKGSGSVSETVVDKVDNYTNRTVYDAVDALSKKQYNSLVIGEGNVVLDQYPKQDTKLLSNDIVMLYTGGDTVKMPDMSGWTQKQVSSFWALTKIQMEIIGHGYVRSQSIAPGTIISKENVVTLTLDLEV